MLRLIEIFFSRRAAGPGLGFVDSSALQAPELVESLPDAPPCECEGAMEALCDWRRCCAESESYPKRD